MPLGREIQQDFSAGEQRDVAPHLIDPRGFFSGENAMLADDGSAFKRGGSQYVSNAPFGSALRYIWNGWLQAGRRTLIASTSAFGALALDGKTPVKLASGGYPSVPKLARAFQDMLFIPGGKIWGGSLKTAEYTAGSVKVTKGSKTVTGLATAWEANVDVGMIFRLAAGGSRAYIVAAVRSNTEIELRDAYEEPDATGIPYTLKAIDDASAPYKAADIYAVVGNRLLVAIGNEIFLSEPEKAHLYEAKILPSETIVQNRHVLEEGTEIISIEAIGLDRAMVFHTGGVTVVSNIALPIVSPEGADQHRIDILSREIVLWGPAGVTGYKGALVVPAVDNVYLMDGTSAPQPVGDAIAPPYREHVLEGHAPGGAWIERDHYFLPILDSSGVPIDLLSARLDRPTRSRGRLVFPWTFHSNTGARVSAAVRQQPAKPGETPVVLAAGSEGRVLDLSTFFRPSAAVKKDHDGTVPNFAVITRDYGTGTLAIGRWRRLDLFYELEAAEGDDPKISVEVGTGIRKKGIPAWDEVVWDEFKWAASAELEFELLEGFAVPNAGGAAASLAQNAQTFYDNTHARFVRYRIQCAEPVAKLTVRGVAVYSAQPVGVRHAKVA